MSITNVPGQGAGIYNVPSNPDDAVAGTGAVAGKSALNTITTLQSKDHVPEGSQQEELLDQPPLLTRQQFAATSQAIVGMGEKDVMSDMYAVMALFQKMAQEMRNSAREVRAGEMNAQVSTLKDAAQEIRNSAEERMKGAIVAGAMQIVGGAMSVGMGVAGGAMQIKAGAKTIDSANLQFRSENVAANHPTASPAQQTYLTSGLKTLSGTTRGEAEQLSGRGTQFTAGGQGASGMFGGIGTIVQATQDKKAAEHDAKRAELEAGAKVHESGVQQSNDLMQQMMDVIRDVRDKLGSIEQSRLETTRGIARNI